nr:MAG TPA: hypothetical protein [Caudoviricetes sp.]
MYLSFLYYPDNLIFYPIYEKIYLIAYSLYFARFYKLFI